MFHIQAFCFGSVKTHSMNVRMVVEKARYIIKDDRVVFNIRIEAALSRT